jgi:1L-myo-inositol 1-phosphate cytidylyltransferase
VLSMADHVYTPDLVGALLRAPRAAGELLLGVDFRLDAVPDPDEATWVRLGPRHRILDIGKRLQPRDAVDTGVFLADRSLFEALAAERCARAGDCALTDGVRRLAREGRARGVDVGDAWWSDVDTHADLLRTEQHLQAAAGARSDSGE